MMVGYCTCTQYQNLWTSISDLDGWYQHLTTSGRCFMTSKQLLCHDPNRNVQNSPNENEPILKTNPAEWIKYKIICKGVVKLQYTYKYISINTLIISFSQNILPNIYIICLLSYRDAHVIMASASMSYMPWPEPLCTKTQMIHFMGNHMAHHGRRILREQRFHLQCWRLGMRGTRK